MRDPDQVNEFVKDVWDHFGRLDVMVNNAGGQFAQMAIDFKPKGWNAVIDTNLNGSWWMMQAAAREWIDRGKTGNIVNI
ncbi:SDR family NAD(P)-dependent oxidoreductase, partial [Klebsiella pneumoniae]|uniref:SDR family NAD(P)-dependent oxidoreductase n=1 Tax=Klebsiella pneumoniae TaxID=573 RepID=UPI003F225A66